MPTPKHRWIGPGPLSTTDPNFLLDRIHEPIGLLINKGSLRAGTKRRSPVVPLCLPWRWDLSKSSAGNLQFIVFNCEAVVITRIREYTVRKGFLAGNPILTPRCDFPSREKSIADHTHRSRENVLPVSNERIITRGGRYPHAS